MKLVLLAIAGLSAFVLLVLWMMTYIQYHVAEKHLKITWLGVSLRKIDLLDIRRVSKRRPKEAAEYWYNTVRPSHRVLTIQRRSGVRRCVVITPLNRYIFLAELQRAIERVKPEAKIEIEPAPEEAET